MEGQSSTVYLDPWGDLKIIAQDRDQQSKTLVVSSSVMRLASPVWRVMLHPMGPFREAQESSKEIDFPDDDADALAILLRIAHLGWRQVPGTISFDNLADLAVLCDKYDMIHFVRPWLAKWQSRPLAIVPGPEEWLLIAWTFGDYPSFVTNAKKLVLSCNTDEAGRLTRGGKVVELDFAPGLVDNMLKARKAILKATLTACLKYTNCYGPEQVRLPDAASSAVTTHCDTLVFWSLKIGLPAISAWPGPVNIDDIHAGIDDLVMQLPNKLCSASRDKDSGRSDHSSCKYSKSGDLMGEVVGIYVQILPTVFEESYRRHMEEQARKNYDTDDELSSESGSTTSSRVAPGFDRKAYAPFQAIIEKGKQAKAQDVHDQYEARKVKRETDIKNAARTRHVEAEANRRRAEESKFSIDDHKGKLLDELTKNTKAILENQYREEIREKVYEDENNIVSAYEHDIKVVRELESVVKAKLKAEFEPAKMRHTEQQL